MTNATHRFGLPLLASGQAQKEITHNEALLLADMLIQPIVEGAPLSSPPASPIAGQCWIVGASASGDWAGHEASLACWTDAGWRFVDQPEGASVWNRAANQSLRKAGSGWTSGRIEGSTLVIDGVAVIGAQRPAIAAPGGGTTVDSEARIAISAILGTLRTHGLIAS